VTLHESLSHTNSYNKLVSQVRSKKVTGQFHKVEVEAQE